MIKIVRIVSIVLLLTACIGKDKNVEQSRQTSVLTPNQPTEVRVKPITRQVFHYELLSNGTVRASRKVNLRFQTLEVVSRIYVKNGDWVKKGQKLATLEIFKLQNALDQAKDMMERAKLELQDLLIGQGFALAKQGDIPESVLKIARVKSGYDQARINFESAEYNLTSASLYAPFDGVVANLTTQERNYPSGSDFFCTVMDLNGPEVQFVILESELSMIKKGDAVLAAPFSDPKQHFKGVVSELNPMVDKNGMVLVKAVLSSSNQNLYDGQNMRVRVQRATESELLIPKTALVFRNNRKVVFICKNGHAQWVYVQTSLENSECFVVTEGLSEGDSVIYEGNLNLAHEAPIVVLK